MVDIVSFILSIVTVAYIFYKNKEKINRLSFGQILAACMSFIFFIGVATVLIYFGGNWIVDKIRVEWISTVVSYIIIVVVIGVVIVLLDKVVGKITKSSQET
ncbi:hypothetical protein [Virgibacillus doumboii]|uniref:hypothetical protein n=1 Tax=Virgibacillus doumboii TaxID=2697503 RepID=UPI0013E0A796|nr:hypothetical protein [Virgibacillus doumboii]